MCECITGYAGSHCALHDGINGPLALSKTKWPGAIWDMNVEGTQWAALGINQPEQTRAFALRVPEQLALQMRSSSPARLGAIVTCFSGAKCLA